VSLDDFLLNLSRKNRHSSLLSAALRKIMCLKFTRLYSFGDIRASNHQEMKFPSIKLQVSNERFLPFLSNFFCWCRVFWVFLCKSEAIFRILFHSEILKFLPRNAFQNGGGVQKSEPPFKKYAQQKLRFFYVCAREILATAIIYWQLKLHTVSTVCWSKHWEG
jgi:hypothetical protein